LEHSCHSRHVTVTLVFPAAVLRRIPSVSLCDNDHARCETLICTTHTHTHTYTQAQQHTHTHAPNHPLSHKSMLHGRKCRVAFESRSCFLEYLAYRSATATTRCGKMHCNTHCNTHCNIVTLQYTLQHIVQHTLQHTLQHRDTAIHTATHSAIHTAALPNGDAIVVCSTYASATKWFVCVVRMPVQNYHWHTY